MLYSVKWCETTCLIFFHTGVLTCLSHECSLCTPSSLSGFRQRRREVLWEAGNPLETCPHLVESVPCEDPTCYLWQVQEEERCIPVKSPCGPGTSVRNVTCVNTEGNVLYLHLKFVVKLLFFPRHQIHSKSFVCVQLNHLPAPTAK